MEYDEITYRKADGVGEITLNRPAQLNPISARPGGTRDQILDALADAEADPDVASLLLTGAGKAFSGGGDLTGNAPRHTAAEQNDFVERAVRFYDRMRAAQLPIVAAVHGYCLGAALQLVATCDIVIAGASARFGVPEGRIGLVGAGPLVPAVGRQWAKFLILTGELIDATRAVEIGLALTVERDEDLYERAQDLCRRLARLPPSSTLLNKRAVDAIADASGDAAGRLAGAARDVITLSDSGRATAPDGRTFREIIDTEGIGGLKAARAAQYAEPWLR
jgi:enoyl-CoA hydratase/carnithine racemase